MYAWREHINCKSMTGPLRDDPTIAPDCSVNLGKQTQSNGIQLV